jgi:hypothetical protein
MKQENKFKDLSKKNPKKFGKKEKVLIFAARFEKTAVL